MKKAGLIQPSAFLVTLAGAGEVADKCESSRVLGMRAVARRATACDQERALATSESTPRLTAKPAGRVGDESGSWASFRVDI